MTRRGYRPNRAAVGRAWIDASRRSPRGDRWAALIGAAGLTMLVAIGCQEPPAPYEAPPLETVDVATDPDFAPDKDPRAAPREGQLAGVLPSDFPDDLPIHLPASVEGFGAEGRVYRVTFTTPTAPATVRTALARALSRRGWQGDVSMGESSLSKADRSVRLTLETAPFGSRFSYTYE